MLQGLALAAESSAQAACTHPLLGKGHKLATDLQQHESEYFSRSGAGQAGLALPWQQCAVPSLFALTLCCDPCTGFGSRLSAMVPCCVLEGLRSNKYFMRQ